MSDFIKTTLGEISENFDNIRVPLSSQQRLHLNKIYPYYGAQNIIDYVDDYLFDGEYILVAEDGENLRSQNNNVCNLVNGKFWVNNHAHIIRASEGNNTKYLCYLLNLIDFKPYVTGSAQPKLTKENLHSIPITIHKKNSQSQIVKVLYELDAKIELNNKINAELESMAKLIYDYWFVQFEFPNEEGKPYKSSGGKMVWNKELRREVPEDWEVEKLSTCCEIIDCLHSKKSDFVFEDEKYYLLQLENISDNGLIDLTSKYYVSNEEYNRWTSRIEVKDNDLVITNAGRVAALSQIPQNVVAGIGRNITAIRPKRILPTFLYYSFNGAEMKRQIKLNTDTGSFFQSLNVRGIKELLIVRPNKEFEEKFESIAIKNRRKRELNNLENQKLAELRNWLLPMLMNGQVKVDKLSDNDETLNMAAEEREKYR